MSALKRRQLNKDFKQTQIQFPHSKSYQEPFSHKLRQIQCLNLQSGAKDNSTPFRSLNRVKSLLCKSPCQTQQDSSKFINSPTQNFLNKIGCIHDVSRPSSVSTACTQSPNELSAMTTTTNTTYSKQRDNKKEKKVSIQQKGSVGHKRPAQTELNQMEYFVMLTSTNAKLVAKMLKLRDKKTGQTYQFPVFKENDVYGGLKANSIINSFDMSKLEVEYDYDTDCEQITYSKKMLLHELCQAIEFFIKEDPIKLVDNVLL